MSTRSGKRIHSSPRGEIIDEQEILHNEIKTRSKRVKKDCAGDQPTEKRRKKHYVTYPSEEANYDSESNGQSNQTLRKSRRNTLKERNFNDITAEDNEERELRNSLKVTRRTRKCEDPTDMLHAVKDVGEIKKNKKKNKKKKMAVDNENELHNEVAALSKKNKKKNNKKKSNCIVVEDVVKNPKSLNISVTSIDSFHSAAGSPKYEECCDKHDISEKKSTPKIRKYSAEMQSSPVPHIQENGLVTSEEQQETRKLRKHKSSANVEIGAVENSDSELKTINKEKNIKKKKRKLLQSSPKDKKTPTIIQNLDEQSVNKSTYCDKNDTSYTTLDENIIANGVIERVENNNTTINEQVTANDTFDKIDKPNGTYDSTNETTNRTFDKNDNHNSTFIKEDRTNLTFESEANTTFDKKDNSNTTIDKKKKANGMFNKNDNLDSTFSKEDTTIITFDKENKADTTYDKKNKINTTFDKEDKANTTLSKEDRINRTFERESEAMNTTFDRKDKTNSTFEKEHESNITFDMKNNANTTCDENDKSNTTFDKDDQNSTTFDKEDKANSTFNKSCYTPESANKANKNNRSVDKLSRVDSEMSPYHRNSVVTKRKSIINDNGKNVINISLHNVSNDNSNESVLTSDMSKSSHISVTSDESQSENILNNTPLLVESSLEEENISNSNNSPIPRQTPPSLLKRQATFTKESPKVTSKNLKSVDKTPTRRKSLPSPGCTPFPQAKSLSKDKSILNITRSIEKSRRSSLAEVVPRTTKVMFCSPSNNPVVVSQMKGKIIKSSLKGSNKSFIFEDKSCPSPPRGAARKRSQTADRVAGAEPHAKRSRLAEPLAAAPSPRPPRLRTRTLSASVKLPEAAAGGGDSPARARRRLPNFAALHARQFARMESLDECQRRRAERARRLLTPTGPVAVDRVSPINENQTPKQLSQEPTRESVKKSETPTKSRPVSTASGYSRFGFKLQADAGGNPFSFTASKAAAAARPAPGLKRQATLPSLAGTTRKQLARQAVMREKSFMGKRDDNRHESRTVIKGVRTNRRFELQMKMRNINA